MLHICYTYYGHISFYVINVHIKGKVEEQMFHILYIWTAMSSICMYICTYIWGAYAQCGEAFTYIDEEDVAYMYNFILL